MTDHAIEIQKGERFGFGDRSWPIVQRVLDYGLFTFFATALCAADVARGRHPARRYSGTDDRGMSLYYDVVDWIGGWPFEVATPEECFRFLRKHDFELIELVTCGGNHGCNEFVFIKRSQPADQVRSDREQHSSATS